jgi:hypothetical protein
MYVLAPWSHDYPNLHAVWKGEGLDSVELEIQVRISDNKCEKAICQYGSRDNSGPRKIFLHKYRDDATYNATRSTIKKISL